MAQFGYTTQFQSIMAIAGILSNKDFQTMLEDAVFPYYTGAERNTDGFVVKPLQPAFDLTYKAIKKRTNVQIMAKHVALDAHAIPNPTKGIEVVEGTIPAIATNITWGKEDYAREAMMLHHMELAGRNLVDAAQDMLVEKFDSKVAEHNARASYMRDYVVFNGKYDITVKNNAGSYSNVTFDFEVPQENKSSLSSTKKWWTNTTFATEGTACDPIKDLDDLLQKAEDKGFDKSQLVIEIGLKTFRALIRHSKVREAIAVFMNPSIAPRTAGENPTLAATTFGMSDEQLAAQLSARLGVDFMVRKFVSAIPVFNQKKGEFVEEQLSGFEEGRLVLRPKGDIGEVIGADHIVVGGAGDANHVNATIDNGRILFKYNCDTREMVQIWDTEEIFLYVLTQQNNMFYLDVC